MKAFSIFAGIRRSLFVPLGLSLRQAAHEWASTLCQCFALSAVVLPILLLIGLKNGILESEWKRLMNDPDALMLSPLLVGGKKDVTWSELQDIARLDGVAVVLPQLSLSDNQVYLDRCGEVDGNDSERRLQIALTRANDKTLTYHKCQVPRFVEGSNLQEAVLNHEASNLLKAKVGDEFTLRPAFPSSLRPPVVIRLKIIDILPADSKAQDEGSPPRVYLPEELGFELMNYNDGFPSSLTGERMTGPTPFCRALLLVPGEGTQVTPPAEEAEEAEEVTENAATEEAAAEEAPAEEPTAEEPAAEEAPATSEAPAAEAPAPAAEEPSVPEAPADAAEAPAAANDEVPTAAEEPAAEEPTAEEAPATSEGPAAEAPAPAAEEPSVPEAPAAEPPPAPRMDVEALSLFAQKTATKLRWGYRIIVQPNEPKKDAQPTLHSLPAGSYLLGPNVSNMISWEHLSQAQQFQSAIREQFGRAWSIYPWNHELKFRYAEKGFINAPWNSPELLAELTRRRDAEGYCTIYTGTGREEDGNTPDFSRATSEDWEDVALLPSNIGHSLVSLRVVTVPGLPVKPPHYLSAPEDLSLLSMACYKEFYWDLNSEDPQKAFYFSNRRFRFRCYAETIDDVKGIQEKLQGEEWGFKIKSSYQDIEKNKKLDANLQKLLLIISAVAGTGAIIALVFNLFNATERRKKDYAILRTLGLGRLALLSLPVYETIIIMAFTLLISFGIYHVLDAVMVHYLTAMVVEGGRVCYIPLLQQLLIAAVTMVLAVLAAMLSSIRLCRLSPAAYIRES